MSYLALCFIFGKVFFFLASVGSGPIFLTRPCGQVQHVSASEWHMALPPQISQLGQHSGCLALKQRSTLQRLTTAKYKTETVGHV